MKYDYAELDGVIYRAENDPEDPDGRFEFAEKLVDRKWINSGDLDKAAMYGSPISKAEAKKHAGKDWPTD